MGKVYIASGWFNESDKSFVEEMEKSLKGSMKDYYSPRDYVISLDPKNPLRSKNCHLILELNKRMLDECDEIWVNAKNPKKDIGTMWELGYSIAKANNSKMIIELFTDDSELIRAVQLLKSVNFESLRNTVIIDEYDHKYIISWNNCENFELLSSIFNLKAEEFKADNYKSMNEILRILIRNKYRFFLTDNHPFQLFILMGYLYYFNIPYYTASMMGYGSNVMIAASSKGHLNLPGIVDFTKTQLKIE